MGPALAAKRSKQSSAKERPLEDIVLMGVLQGTGQDFVLRHGVWGAERNMGQEMLHGATREDWRDGLSSRRCMCVWNSRIWVTLGMPFPICTWVSVMTEPSQTVPHVTTEQPCENHMVAVPSLTGLGSAQASLGRRWGVAIGWGQPLGDLWCQAGDPSHHRDGEQLVRSGLGRDQGSCCCCDVGRTEGFMAGSAGRSCRAAGGWVTPRLWEGARAHRARQRKRVQGGNVDTKHRVQASPIHTRPGAMPCTGADPHLSGHCSSSVALVPLAATSPSMDLLWMVVKSLLALCQQAW